MPAQSRRLSPGPLFGRLLTALCLLLAAGCASEPHGADARAEAALPGKPACFWLMNFDGSWTALNQRELLVYAPLTSPPYVVQLLQPVITLRFAERLGFEDVEHTGMICNNAGDYALIPNYQPHRIPIIAVHQVTREQARALMLANGLKVPPEKKPPQKSGP